MSCDAVGLESGVVYIYPWAAQRFSFNRTAKEGGGLLYGTVGASMGRLRRDSNVRKLFT